MHRGGNCLSVTYEFLVDGDIAIHDDRWLTYPWGVRGGDPGMRSTKRLERADGTEEWLPAKCDGVMVKEGDVLYFNTWGGGGWGNPLERDADLVAFDARRGLVSNDGANRYGVVIAADGSVDAGATEKLRDEMAASKVDTGLFSRGGTIEEIKARSIQETHLPAPEAP